MVRCCVNWESLVIVVLEKLIGMQSTCDESRSIWYVVMSTKAALTVISFTRGFSKLRCIVCRSVEWGKIISFLEFKLNTVICTFKINMFHWSGVRFGPYVTWWSFVSSVTNKKHVKDYPKTYAPLTYSRSRERSANHWVTFMETCVCCFRHCDTLLMIIYQRFNSFLSVFFSPL